jgi:hypothetical protein
MARLRSLLGRGGRGVADAVRDAGNGRDHCARRCANPMRAVVRILEEVVGEGAARWDDRARQHRLRLHSRCSIRAVVVAVAIAAAVSAHQTAAASDTTKLT